MQFELLVILFRSVIVGSIVKICVKLGLVFTTYIGFNHIFELLKDEIYRLFMDIDPLFLDFFGLLRVDDAITVIFSAYAVSLLIKGIGNSFTKVSS